MFGPIGSHADAQISASTTYKLFNCLSILTEQRIKTAGIAYASGNTDTVYIVKEIPLNFVAGKDFKTVM
jgi:hypothetical protein